MKTFKDAASTAVSPTSSIQARWSATASPVWSCQSPIPLGILPCLHRSERLRFLCRALVLSPGHAMTMLWLIPARNSTLNGHLLTRSADMRYTIKRERALPTTGNHCHLHRTLTFYIFSRALVPTHPPKSSPQSTCTLPVISKKINGQRRCFKLVRRMVTDEVNDINEVLSFAVSLTVKTN